MGIESDKSLFIKNILRLKFKDLQLNTKVLLILIAVWILFGVGNYAISRWIIFPSFFELEHQEAKRNMNRIVQAFEREIFHLNTLCGDWSVWDDTYSFVAKPYKEYMESNLNFSTFQRAGLNLIYICDTAGKVVWRKVYDIEKECELTLPEFPSFAFPENHPMILKETDGVDLSGSKLSGIVRVEKGIMIFACRPILDSDGGGPLRGTFIMGRLLSDQIISEIQNQTRLSFSVSPLQNKSISNLNTKIVDNISVKSPYHIEDNKKGILQVSTVFNDFEKNPAFLITAEIEAKIIEKGLETTRYALNSTIASIIGLLFAILLIIKRAENELRKDHDLLELRVEERTTELSSANELLRSEIHEHKITTEALRRSEELYSNIFESVSDGIQTLDQNFHYTHWNRAMEKIAKKTRQQVIGVRQKAWEIFPHLSEHVVDEMMKRSMRGEVVQRENITHSFKDGTEMVTSETFLPLKNPDGNIRGIVGVIRDITEQKKSRERAEKLHIQLQQTQKMEAISTLAGGIAHEFNNALSSVCGHIELLQMDFPGENEIKRHIENMQTSTGRMANLTNQLLAYAKGGKYQSKNISLYDYVNNTLSLLRHKIGESIHTEKDLTNKMITIKADLTQMQMVLSAALLNSSEAIDGKGKIKVTTREVKIDEGIVKSNLNLKPGRYAYITIEDDGKGMDEGTLGKLFEPFFTTKFQGRGLGMAAAYGIIKNHDGEIFVESQKNNGTKVHIYLPALDMEMSKPEKPRAEIMAGTGTVLLIEDETFVREVSRALLEKLGYRVLEAKTGTEAISIAESFKGDINLALLDIGLPDMKGGEIYSLLTKACPNIKVIVCSGYTIDGPAQQILDLGAQDFIQKPFTISALSEKLNNVLWRTNQINRTTFTTLEQNSLAL